MENERDTIYSQNDFVTSNVCDLTFNSQNGNASYFWLHSSTTSGDETIKCMGQIAFVDL